MSISKKRLEGQAGCVKIRDCSKCLGWGYLFIKAGIPNVVKKCPLCKGTGITFKK